MKDQIFVPPIEIKLTNYKTGEVCTLVSVADLSTFNESDLERITAICNQESVYEMLFETKLAGQPYDEHQAQNFLDWAAAGWRDQSWFVFLLRNSRQQIIGAVDIKSDDLRSAEIGYWADEATPGVMTNALATVIALAKDAGYHELFATTKLENFKSQGVLLRNGFVKGGELKKPDGPRFKFTLTF